MPKHSGDVRNVVAKGSGSPVGSWALHLYTGGKFLLLPVMQASQQCGAACDCIHGKRVHAGAQSSKTRHLGVRTTHFNNLTDILRNELASGDSATTTSSSRRRSTGGAKQQLGNTADASSNLAIFQVTGELPLTLDFVFTGSVAPVDSQASARSSCMSRRDLSTMLLFSSMGGPWRRRQDSQKPSFG